MTTHSYRHCSRPSEDSLATVGFEVQLPDLTEPQLQFLTQAETFMVAELPGELDLAGRLVLVADSSAKDS
jgi:hypothetical protein